MIGAKNLNENNKTLTILKTKTTETKVIVFQIKYSFLWQVDGENEGNVKFHFPGL